MLKKKYETGKQVNDSSIYMVEGWMIDSTLPRRERLCVALQLAGADKSMTKLTAEQQRALIGYAVFGQKNVGINNNGNINIAMQIDFGLDCLSGDFPVDMLIELADKKQKFNW